MQFNNNEIQIRGDGYVNATQMCKSADKKLKDFKKLPGTKDFVEILGRQNITLELYQKQKGSIHNRHTFAHPQIAIKLAQWISPEFDVWVTERIFQLMTTGEVQLNNQLNSNEILKEFKRKLQSVEEEKQQLNIQFEETKQQLITVQTE